MKFKIPLNKILVETDSPYLSPHPLGKTNHPENTFSCKKNFRNYKTIEDISKMLLTT